jgi:hypothetical protein
LPPDCDRRSARECRRIAASSSRRRLVDECGADFGGHASVAHFFASFELAPPRLEVIHPRHDGTLKAAGLRRGKLRRPHIVALRLHLDFEVRIGGALEFPAQHHAQLVVTVREAVGFNGNAFAHDTLGGKSATIHGGSMTARTRPSAMAAVASPGMIEARLSAGAPRLAGASCLAGVLRLALATAFPAQNEGR